MATATAKKAKEMDMDDDSVVEARIYEIALLYPHPMGQKEEQELLKSVDAIFAEAGAVLKEKDVWGRRGLAYPIKGNTEGNFVIYYFDIDPAKIREIDDALRIVPGVLRHLIVKPPKGYQITQYSKTYDEWMKTRETVEEVRERETEEALREKVVAKAKRQAKKADEEKKATTKDEPVLEGEKLTEELEKIISDDELDL